MGADPYPPMARYRARSLALHEAVAHKLLTDPQEALRLAQRNMRHLRTDPHAAKWAAEWEAWLQRPVADIAAMLVDPDPAWDDLRATSPFAGLLSPQERWAIYRAFRLTR